MISDAELESREKFVEALSNSLPEIGPKGQKLAAEIAPLLAGRDVFEIIVAINLILCFLEDTSGMPKEQIDFTSDFIYSILRTQIDMRGPLQ